GGQRIRLAWSGRGAAAYRLVVRDGSGPSRVAIPSTRLTSTLFTGHAGHAYSFVVSALHAGGSVLASSQPLRVALPAPPAAAATGALTLTASTTGGPAPLAVDLQAVLSPAKAGRKIVLEAYSGSAWQTADESVTDASGRAAWTFTLDAGLYRVRARYAGST